jgi:hypothetical protein
MPSSLCYVLSMTLFARPFAVVDATCIRSGKSAWHGSYLNQEPTT